MFASRIFQLFLVAIGVLAVAQAINFDALLQPAGTAVARRAEDDHAKQVAAAKRQEVDPGDLTDAADPDLPTTPTPDPTDGGGDEPTSPSAEPTPPTRTTPTSRPTSAPTSDAQPEETTSSSSSEEDEEEKPQTEEPITEVETVVLTTTNGDGSIETRTSEQTTTRTPGLSGGQNDGGSSGMSAGTRKTVIGVVVGIGGAVVLGALAFVAWRIWGRRRAAASNDDGLAGYGGSAAPYAPMDKSEAGSSGGGTIGHARNPFQSTLETYHAPTHVNASSNF